MVERGPTYRLIADRLRAAIETGRYRPGQRLPSAHDLAAEWGVNEHTARDAMKLLERAGLIVVRHGQATRVAADEREKVQVKARHIQISARPATEDEAAAWGITEGSPVLIEIDDQRHELRAWPAALTILDITDG